MEISAPVSLHKEFNFEKRGLLFKRNFVLSRADQAIYKTEEVNDAVWEWLKHVDQLIEEMNPQIKKTSVMNSTRYTEMIEKIKALDANRKFEPFSVPAKDLGYPLKNKHLRRLMPRYQIFLSFRGKDTRDGFTHDLYQALTDEGFKTFIDDKGLQTGDKISQSLYNAIGGSRLSIVILSENYAESSWCLEELIKILDCMDNVDQMVWPIFYKVDPTDVRFQKKSYANAMAKHERRYGESSEEVKKWRSALHGVCELSGKHYDASRKEDDFIEEIVSEANKNKDFLNIESMDMD
uniref:TIR domain-containing protein n=1 Tax=Lotus japonicus TaxID=34305 RepID=I3SQQ4_LOTJA|nr:unknown [Lotus japonicus]